VDAEERLRLLLLLVVAVEVVVVDGCGGDDADSCCLAEVMPLAASSSLTRAKYDASG